MNERKGTIGFGSVKVKNARVTAVEKGNVGTPANVDDVVIAFTVKPEGFAKNVKAIVKGDLAVVIYGNFLSEGRSMDKTLDSEETDLSIKRTVMVSYEGDLKEERANEVVLQNLRNVVFNFEYNVVGQ